jgi:hypothetical protein
MRHVADLQFDQVAAAQLAVDRQVEQGQVARLPLQFKADSDRPDLLRLQRRLLTDNLSLFPGQPCAGSPDR